METIDWRDFAGIPYWEIDPALLSEAVIKTEIKSIIDGLPLPFTNYIPGLSGTFIFFKITNKLIITKNEYISRGQTLPNGNIEIEIIKPYKTKNELNLFKHELSSLLHHELTHYFQIQRNQLNISKSVSNIKQYISLATEIMAYANQASKTISKVELEMIIALCKFDENQTIASILEMYGDQDLFKNGNGIIWLYFIWFKKGDTIRKRFLKYFAEYQDHLYS